MHYDLRKVLLFFLILVLPAFIFKEYHVLKSARESYVSKPAPVEKRLDIKHAFVFVMIVEGNTDFFAKTCNSIFTQNYDHYRVVIVDNGSTDGSFGALQSYLYKKHSYRKNITLCQHLHRLPYAKVIKEVLKECKDDEIVILLDPSDWLAHQNVLTSLNEAYADPEVWLTYPGSLEYPSYRKTALHVSGMKVHARKPYRTPWVESGMKTFYAHLMKDMDIEGTQEAKELFIPMINLAKWHIRYIPDTLYIHNRLQLESDQDRFQIGLRLDALTRSIYSQSTLAKAHHVQSTESKKADMIIFSTNQPFQLGISLESIYRYVRGIDCIYVLYEAQSSYQQAYADLQRRFPNVNFFDLSERSNEFKPLLLSLLNKSLMQSPYVALVSDGLLVKDPIYFQDCTNALSQTKAFAFFLDVDSLTVSSSVANTDRIHIIEMEQSQMPAPFNMVLYSKPDLVQDLSDMEFNSSNSLLKIWGTQSKNCRLGLFYDMSKVAHIH
ncbi:MAG: glycosyltransferase family 2 protein [Chlamydiales bacterium]|nr:glycosyltransferase family 2 protein [Chlamydiales bacterium]